MLVHQCTIEKPASYSGTGLHTGVECTLTFKPAPENYGIRFVRTDLGGNPEIPALVDYVVDVSRGTTLGHGDIKIYTVEHVLAAVVGLEIDNIIIEINNIEPPVGDGSAMPYVETLQAAGIKRQEAAKDYLVIDKTIHYRSEEDEVDIVALPTDAFRITVMVDYKNPALGSQHTGLFSLEKEFVKEFAPARTFCFLTEVEALHDAGLIKGGSLDNAVVIVDRDLADDDIESLRKKLDLSEKIHLNEHGFLNNVQLRFKNEPARHKALDLLGDLALVGAPLRAQILAARPGHASNVEFAKMIRKLYLQKKLVMKYQYEKKEGVVFDHDAILNILPHRYPILLVDKIIELDLDHRIVGVKNVTGNEPFFEGHFPGRPIMPGVLIVEAMAQTGGILLLNSVGDPKDKLVYFMSIEKAKFRKPVVPGDQIIMEVEMRAFRRNICEIEGKSFVNGNLVAEAVMKAAIMPRETKPQKT